MDAYDGTDEQGEPVCGCPMCRAMMDSYDARLVGITLYREQITWHLGQRRFYILRREDWQAAEQSAILHTLVAYRRRMRAAS